MTQNNTALTNEPDHNVKIVIQTQNRINTRWKRLFSDKWKNWKKGNRKAQLIDDNLVWTFTARVHFRGVEPSFTIKVPLTYRVRVQYRKLRTDFLPAQIYFSRVINPSRKNETKGHTEKMLWNKLFNLVGRTANYSRKLTNHSHVLTERYDKLT